MTWGMTRFEEFFAAANAGRLPYRWQSRLAERVVSTGYWPEVIAAPTGSGKSTVVDIHVYAVAAAADAAVRPPRRMAVVVNRRALVDAHLERAERLSGLLQVATGGVLAEAADRLRSLSGTGQALLVASIRGGVPTDPAWIDDPCVPEVIAATPDMWGSRLLFCGYGTSRYARPREAGLLAVDSVMVLDEAHLNRQLLQTAHDAADIVAAPVGQLGSVPGLQVVAMTATPDLSAPNPAVPGSANTAPVGGGVDRLAWEGVRAQDLDAEPGLRAALTAPKPVRVLATAEVSDRGAAADRYVGLLAREAVELADRVDKGSGLPRTVLCVVNTVRVAVALAEALEKDVGAEAVACWVGRMRPLDLDALRAQRPGLFTTDGDPGVAFLVATQTVEVGIDIDCAGLLTELAAGSALTQRFGRVNRRGLRKVAPIVVVAPDGPVTEDRLPYRAEDLEAARLWTDLIATQDASPWALLDTPAPAESLRRLALSELYPEHIDLLAQTSDRLMVEHDLDFWLRDDLEASRDSVGFVLRSGLPTDDTSALALLRVTPVAPREIFPTSIGVAVALAAAVFDRGQPARVFCWRAGDLMTLTEQDRVRPGDQLVVDAGHSLTRRGVVIDSPPAIAELHATVWGEDGIRVILPGHPDEHWLADLAEVSAEEAQQMTASADAASTAPVQVVLPPAGLVAEDGRLPWVVLKPSSQVAQDAEARQEWTPRHQPVLLVEHQQAVAGRARRFAINLRLASELVVALEAAGLHHDDGKTDATFQTVLRGADPALRHLVLAKSGDPSAQQTQRRRGRSSWRHEQLSAVHAWRAESASAQRDLVVRLVGTSHGRGRPFFPSGSASLLGGRYPADVATDAEALFRTGAGWAEVLHDTDRRYGTWGTAFLEAVLRAADCQVSKEGS